jgi:hypothetical protein
MRYFKEWDKYGKVYDVLTIEYNHEPGEEMVHTEPNGDPGTPGYAAGIEIMAIYVTLKDENNNQVTVDILPLTDEFITEGDVEDFEEEILNYHGR